MPDERIEALTEAFARAGFDLDFDITGEDKAGFVVNKSNGNQYLADKPFWDYLKSGIGSVEAIVANYVRLTDAEEKV